MKIIQIVFACMAATFLIGFNYPDQSREPWPVPEEYRDMENPLKASSDVLASGEMLYDKHCKSCHGDEGLGDGPKADRLDTPCGDFTTEEFKKQSDGAIFYKTKFGREDMPEFKKKIPYDEDIWAIVHYVKTLE